DASSYRQFFKWVTDSIKTSSESVENAKSGFEMAHFDENTITKIDAPKSSQAPDQFLDPNFVVLAGKCQNTKRPYLMKYAKIMKPSTVKGLDLQTLAYRLVGAFQVDQTYYELSDEYSIGVSTKINSNELIGAPTCPCCGNQFGFAVCGCGKIHCIGEEEESTCPWCGSKGKYTAGSGDKGFDVNRSQG
nr:VWA domain-containing protein [Bacteroidota bacterium]